MKKYDKSTKIIIAIAVFCSLMIASFFFLCFLKSLDSVILSTFMRSTIQQGEWKTVVMIFVLTAVLGVLERKYQERMISFCKRIDRKIEGTECD